MVATSQTNKGLNPAPDKSVEAITDPLKGAVVGAGKELRESVQRGVSPTALGSIDRIEKGLGKIVEAFSRELGLTDRVPRATHYVLQGQVKFNT